MKLSKISYTVIVLLFLSVFSCKKANDVEPRANFSPLIIEFGDVTFKNKSLNATEFLWDFGDGNTSTDIDPVHSYKELGTYTVVLTASDGINSDSYAEIIAIGQIFPDNLTKLDDLPFGAIADVTYVTHEDNGYIVGGFRFDNAGVTNPLEMWQFDSNDKTWELKSESFPTPTRNGVGFIANDELYCGLGNQDYQFYKNSLQQPDFISSVSLPLNFGTDGAITKGRAFSFNNKGYVIGRGTFWQNANPLTMWKFDPTTEIWSSETEVPINGDSGMYSFLIGDKLYVGLGVNNSTFIHETDFWEYKFEF